MPRPVNSIPTTPGKWVSRRTASARRHPLRRSLISALGVVAAVALASCSTVQETAASAPTRLAAGTEHSECTPEGGAEYICGVNNVEDFVRLPGDRLIGSDLAAPGKQGYLYLFGVDRTVHTISAEEIGIAPDPAYARCAGAPDWTVFRPHGMDIATTTGDHATLYVVNHGGREAVEIFSVDLSVGDPTLTWTGCLTAPQDAWPDDVAALPDGGLLVTSLWDPRDEEKFQKAVEGEPNGELLEWHADSGWTSLPTVAGRSGPNGVIVSPDGSTVYLAAWSGKQLLTIDRTTDAVDTINLDYTPDNLTWAADGKTIFVGGTTANVKDALDCDTSPNVNCPWTGVRVDRFDPASGTIDTLINGNEFGEFGMTTGAIDLGDELWVNSYHSDRVAVFPLN
ncbi:YncE family protein [Rhodococcus sp. NPDC057529]|uniref:YncE family protein n=1 Tax=Rhodococcus sp. NPDC057529 TaxID=3346158 RepID=UPI00366FDD8A